MPSYLSLLNWTHQGVTDAEESAKRIEAFRQSVSDAGGRLIFLYMLMGEYDFASLIEVESDEIAAELMIRLGEKGNVRSQTMRAFTEDESKTLLRKIWPE
jgi:uncharacterized protein with GYD domain